MKIISNTLASSESFSLSRVKFCFLIFFKDFSGMFGVALKNVSVVACCVLTGVVGSREDD